MSNRSHHSHTTWIYKLQQAGGWGSSTVAQSYVEEGSHSRLQISQRFEASSNITSTSKKPRTDNTSSSSKGSNERFLSHIPTISIGAGSSNNHIHLNIGHPQAFVAAVEEEST